MLADSSVRGTAYLIWNSVWVVINEKPTLPFKIFLTVLKLVVDK